jgi:hypothetical protein
VSLLFECVGVYVSVSCACARVRICIVYNLGTQLSQARAWGAVVRHFRDLEGGIA